MPTRATPALVVVLGAVVLGACAGSASPTVSAVPPGDLQLVFETGGGCYDTAEPVGCGEHPYGVVADDDLRARLYAAAPRLAAVDPGPNGCGDEFVDGVSVRVRLDRRVPDGGDSHVACLSALSPEDPLTAELWDRYEDARADE